MNQNEGIVVLSLFDGMSGGQIALDRLNVSVKSYYASEIDKHAIIVTQKNYPDTIQLGSVVDVNVFDLPKIDLLMGGSPCQSFSFAGKRKGMSTKDSVEILTLDHYLQLKAESYEFEGQSYLFWEYMRILEDIRKSNPDVKFLLENVEMGDKWEKVLSKAIGVNPLKINSALVSAQNRKRLYWTNIGMVPSGLFGDLASIIPQPKDKGILLKHVLEKDVAEKYFLSDKMLKYFDKRAANFNQGKVNIREEEWKASCLTSSMSSCDISDNFVAIDCSGNEYTDKSGALLSRYHKRPANYGTDSYIKVNKDLNPKSNQDKASCFTTGGNSGGDHSDMDLIVVHNTMPRSSTTGKGGTGPLSRAYGKTYCLDTGNTNAIEYLCVASRGRNPENPKSREAGLNTEQMLEPRNDGKTNCLTSVQKDNLVMQLNPSKESGGNQPYQQNRVYDIEGISPSLLAQMSSGTHAIKTETRIRRLTPTECERLQTVADNYTSGVSDTQRYRMLGNGWTIDVIAHILSYANFVKKM